MEVEIAIRDINDRPSIGERRFGSRGLGGREVVEAFTLPLLTDLDHCLERCDNMIQPGCDRDA